MKLDDIARIQRMFKAGNSAMRIHKITGFSHKYVRDALRHEAVKQPPLTLSRTDGEHSPRAKLNHEKAREIRQLKELGRSTKYLAEKFGVSRYTIGEVLRGRYWNETPQEATN